MAAPQTSGAGLQRLLGQGSRRARRHVQQPRGSIQKRLDGTYLRIDPAAGGTKELERDEGDGSRIWFSTEMKIELQPEEFQRAIAGLRELLDPRNQMVHHLLDRFDLRDDEGCRAADAHLVDAHSQIDRHYAVLPKWTFATSEGDRMMAEFMANPAYADFLIFGIHPDGPVD